MLKPYDQKNFNTLVKAFKRGNVALLECQEKATGKAVPVIVTIAHRDGEYLLTPFATMFSSNPFELLNPPTPGGGFDQ